MKEAIQPGSAWVTSKPAIRGHDGTIVPIIGMRIKSNSGTPTYDQFTVVIIVNIAVHVVGMVIDVEKFMSVAGTGLIERLVARKTAEAIYLHI